MWPLVAALEECPGYFYRAQPTVLVTDHASLVAVAENDFEKLTAAGLARRLRWRLKVQEANVTVWPIPGVANWLADALSRPDVVEDTLAGQASWASSSQRWRNFAASSMMGLESGLRRRTAFG